MWPGFDSRLMQIDIFEGIGTYFLSFFLSCFSFFFFYNINIYTSSFWVFLSCYYFYFGSPDASAGNRTRVTSMATMYSTTRPLMPLSFMHPIIIIQLPPARPRNWKETNLPWMQHTNTHTDICWHSRSRVRTARRYQFYTYTWPGSNWRPSACKADVKATRPQVL